MLDWETLKSSEIVKVYNNLNHNTQIQMCISTVQYMLCKVELPGKYSYFPKVCKAIQMYAQQQRVLTSRPLQVWSQLMRKVLTIYGLSPTQQTAPTELLLDFQRSIYGLNRHNSKLPRNSCRISDNAVMVLQPHNSKLPRNLCRICFNLRLEPTQQQAPKEPLQDFQQRFKTQVPDPNPKSHLDLKSLWK